MEHTPITQDDAAAEAVRAWREAMRAELEAEQRAFNEWLAQPCDDPNPNRWRHHG